MNATFLNSLLIWIPCSDISQKESLLPNQGSLQQLKVAILVGKSETMSFQKIKNRKGDFSTDTIRKEQDIADEMISSVKIKNYTASNDIRDT